MAIKINLDTFQMRHHLSIHSTLFTCNLSKNNSSFWRLPALVRHSPCWQFNWKLEQNNRMQFGLIIIEDNAILLNLKIDLRSFRSDLIFFFFLVVCLTNKHGKSVEIYSIFQMLMFVLSEFNRLSLSIRRIKSRQLIRELYYVE